MFRGRPAPFYRTPLLGGRGYYVRFDQNDDDGGVHIRTFARATAKALVAAAPRFVIMDMRFNSGGNYLLTAGFMRGLPKSLPRTRFYVLMSASRRSWGARRRAPGRALRQFAGTTDAITGPISSWSTRSAIASWSVGSRLTMASCAPLLLASSGKPAAG